MRDPIVTSKATRSDWLSPEAAAWVTENRDALEAIYGSFHGTGEWPDPVQLQRELRAMGARMPLARIANDMPRELGWRSSGPDRVVLSLFGIACCRAAKHLLKRYLEVLRLALERHDRPDLQNRLSRKDVDAALGLSQVEANRLSKLILADCPFLSSGTASVDSWDLSIDERVIDYEAAHEIDDFLAILTEQRSPPRVLTGTVPGEDPILSDPRSGSSTEEFSHGSENPTPANAALVVLAIGANILAILLAPFPHTVAILSASVLAALLFWLRPGVDLTTAALIILATAVGTGAVSALVRSDEPSDRKEPVSVGEQLDSVLAQAAQERRYAVVT